MTEHNGAAPALRVLVVDDERPALADLVWLLSAQPAVGTVDTAVDATEALRLLESAPYDAVFLDIRMPGLTGLELARVLARYAAAPAVVFVSAFESHAVEAFEVAAVDYLLKPVSAERLAVALGRISDAALPPGDPPRAADDLAIIPVEAGGSTKLVERDAVRYAEASGDYVRLHTAAASHLVRIPMSALEEHWGNHGFVRVHRRYLVALRHVSELKAESAGGYAVLVAGVQIPVSRRHSRDLKDRLVRAARRSAAK
ncbi:MAG: LytTR family DNA-binding domain-containing protein [Mycobacteriales bacterium]